MSQHYLNDFLVLASTQNVLSLKVKLAADTHMVFLHLDTKKVSKMCNFLPVILFSRLYLFCLSLECLKNELRMVINTVSIVMY